MEVDEVEAPASASQERQTSILFDGFMPLCDESLLKRDGDSAQMSEEAQAKRKKRRSSMAATRRSITQGMPGLPCSQESVPGTETLVASQDSNYAKENSQQTDEKPKLKPNPVNLQRDEVIDQMQDKIKTLNNESKRWKEIYAEWAQRAKESEKLLEKPVLYIEDMPKEVVEYGRTHYISRPLMDLDKVREDIATSLEHCDIDRQCVAMDFKLLKDTMLHLQRQNMVRAARLASATQANEDNMIPQTKSIDSRDLVQDLLDNW